MNKTWLIKENNKNLILFFSGFAMEKEYFSHLKSSNYDVLYFDNYINFDCELDNFDNYDKVFVLSYSLGVFVYSKLKENFPKPEKITVINGTCKPISECFGINDKVFQGTIDNFNEVGKLKFLRRVFGNLEIHSKLKDIVFTNSPEFQKKELEFLQNQILNSKENYFKPNTVFVSEKDKIFLPNNQKQYWKNENIVLLPGCGHFPFLNFESFDELF